MHPVALGAAAFLGGRALYRAVKGEPADRVSAVRLPDVDDATLASVVLEPNATTRLYNDEASIALLLTLSDRTLDGLTRRGNASFYQLRAVTEKWHVPAIEQLALSRHDVYCSISCLAGPPHPAVVVIVPAGTLESVATSRYFARFDARRAAMALQREREAGATK